MLSNIINVANNGLKGNAEFLTSYTPQKWDESQAYNTSL